MADAQWNPTKNPGHYIARIARAFTRIGDARLREVGFATAQLPVLSALKDGAKLSQAELARGARVEQPSMAQLLARMERDGHIRREPDPNDGRSSLIALTKEARAKLPAGQAILNAGNREALRGLSKEEIATFVSLLQRVLANAEEMEKRLDT
ncbi:MAG: MarR family transcriptional regulator [Alphaproteobacteria bacterium]